MIRIVWPLVVVVFLDVIGIPPIVARYLEGSITDRLEGAYIGVGLCILQIPFCLYGHTVSRNARNIHLKRVYAVHAFFTFFLAVATNIDWF
jgi:hypothetical protein